MSLPKNLWSPGRAPQYNDPDVTYDSDEVAYDGNTEPPKNLWQPGATDHTMDTVDNASDTFDDADDTFDDFPE